MHVFTIVLAFAGLLAPSSPQATGDPLPCFEGTGGPGGDFDWVVHAGEVFFFDTRFTAIVGGPGGAPTKIQYAKGGVVDVRNLVIEEGGTLRAQGPNPMRVLASGEVIVRGLLDVSGFNAHDVATLNTGNQIEHGGVGGAGGGRGGDANVVTTASSPRGGSGQGPFSHDAGGQGGESAVAPPALGKDARRPGGGAGGSFARAQGFDPLTDVGLAAQNGADGSPLSIGAETGEHPARGGVTRPGPFTDGDPRNDFYGTAPLLGPGGELVDKIAGELPRLCGGFGGGGGGNAIPASEFPNPSWTSATDEKGGPGGGGGGVLHVQALGRIVFGRLGEIRSKGGLGATGENTNFLDHVGGSGASGSGGHVVLESATQVDFTDGGTNALAEPRDWLNARGGPRRVGPTMDVNASARLLSHGGAGGPGVVQIHVPDPTLPPGEDPARAQIVVPASVALMRDPLDGVASPAAIALYLTCTPVPRAIAGNLGAPRHALLRAIRRLELAALGRSALEEWLDVGRGLDALRLPGDR